MRCWRHGVREGKISGLGGARKCSIRDHSVGGDPVVPGGCKDCEVVYKGRDSLHSLRSLCGFFAV